MSKSTSMGKKKLGLIIGGAAVVVLVGLTALLLLLPQGEDEAEVSSIASSDETVKLISEDSAALESVTIKNPLDEYTVEAVGDSIWRIKDIMDFEPNKSRYESIQSTASSITASKVVMENCENLSDFGFDAPSAQMDVKFTNGNSYSLTVGDMSPDQIYRYVIETGKNTVYAVGQSALIALDYNRFYYLDTSVVPAYTDEEGNAVIPTINYFKVERPDLARPIVLEQGSAKRSQELGFSSATSAIMQELIMTSPVTAMVSLPVRPTNEEADQYDPVSGNFGMQAASVVAVRPTAEQLTEYGFDKPTAVMEMRYNDTINLKLTVGAALNANLEPAKDGEAVQYYYVMKDGLDEVFCISKLSMRWIDLQPKTILSAVITLPSINDVDALEISVGGAAPDILKVTTTWSEPASSDEQAKATNTFTFNGTALTTDDQDSYARQLYQLMMNPSLQNVNWDRQPTGSPDATATFKLTDGTDIRIDIYVEDDLTTIVSLNGNNSYIGRSGYLEKIQREVQNMRDGIEVKANW